MSSTLRNPLLLPVYVPAFLLAFCNGLAIPILPLYAKSFGVSYSLVGLVLAAEGIGRLIGDLPAAVLVNRLGRKNAMVLGVSCVALSVSALFIAPSVPLVIALRFITGIGGAVWNISRHAYLADITTSRERGRALSIFGGVNRIGTFIGPAVGGFLAASYTLRAPFLAFGGIAALATLIAAVAIERRKTPLPAPGKGHLHYFASIIRQHARMFLTAGSGQLFAQMIRGGRQVIVPLFGADVLGLGYEEVGLIVSIAGFVDMALFYPAGLIMDRYGRKFAIVPCFALQAAGMACIPLTGGFIGLLMATCVIGFGNGLGSGTMMTLGADLAPKETMGGFLGLWRLIGDGGHMGAPLAVGSIADWLGLTPATQAIASVGLLSATIFAFFVPETLRAPARPHHPQ